MCNKILYRVSGTGPFPKDMLRYDEAEAINPADRAQIETQTSRDYDRPPRAVEIQAKRCTRARWLSFGWVVGPIAYPSL